jgi:hypothetical protein
MPEFHKDICIKPSFLPPARVVTNTPTGEIEVRDEEGSRHDERHRGGMEGPWP